MMYIRKGAPPKVLDDYKKAPNASFDGLPSAVKDAWRDSLLQEQGWLCAYTMQSIEPGLISGSNKSKVKLEHIEPQNNTKQNDLSHANVVAVCNGNEGFDPKDQYADTRKGQGILDRRLHPTNPAIENIILYRRNGEIYTGVPGLDEQLFDLDDRPSSKLNLNYKTLLDGRKGAYEAVKHRLDKKDWSLPALSEAIRLFENPDRQGRKIAFCGFVLYLLRKKYEQERKKKA